MADVTFKRFDQLDSYQGQFLYAGRGLGVRDLTPGSLVRVGAAQKRKIHPGPKGATILALGGTPGKAYEPPKRGTRSA